MKLFRNRLSKILQQKSKNRNQNAFDAMVQVGFTPAQARRALIAANAINVRKLADGAAVTAPTIYAACYGRRNNSHGKAILAEALDIPIAELFPEAPEAHDGAR